MNVYKAKRVRSQKRGLKITKSYSYECPITLCQSIENNDNITLNFYIIEIGAGSSYLALLTTLPISEIPDFHLYLANKGGDWENNEKLYKIYTKMKELQKHSWNESNGDTANEIFEQLFSEEKVKIIPKGTKQFSKKEMNVLFKFYVRFNSDIYQIPSEKIATTFFSFTEKTSEERSNQRTYLLLPGTSDHNIDEKLIFDFLEYKRNINEMKPEESLAATINVLKGNSSVLANALNTSIFESCYGNNAKYYCVDIIVEPLVQKAKEFIALVARYYTKQSYDEILELFNLTHETAEQMTVDELLYVHNAEKVPFLSSFKKIDAKYGLQTDRSAALLFVQPPLTPTTFDFINVNKILTNYPSCRKHKVMLTSLMNFPIVSAQWLKRHPFSVAQVDAYMKIPSIMVQIERYVMVNEFRGAKKIVAHTEDLFIATCTASYDFQKNNECLETVGDSVLKLIVSIFLFVKFPVIQENELTERRIQYITNEVLMHLGLACRVPYFLKSKRRNANEWRPPYMKHEEKIMKHELTGKQVADCVEAIIGASFLYNYELYYPTILLKQLGLPVYEMIINSNIIKKSNLIIPSQFLPEQVEDFHEDMTYLELNRYFREINEKPRKYKCGKAYSKMNEMAAAMNWSKAKYATILVSSVLSRFERKILQYRFKNKAYLVFALNSSVDKTNPLFYQNYERLEFLGDSIVEIYVLANAFKIFRSMNRDITPTTLQNLKISILTNAFMARVAVLNEFHRYLITSSPEIINEVDDFVEKLSFKKKYKSFVKHELQVPKILSDIFESLAAALLYDGGWEAVHQVYGRLLGPYIKFFCLFYHKMDTNIVEKLKEKVLEQ